MKKLLITLGLLTITVLPVLATDWFLVNQDDQMYIDTANISKYNQVYERNNIYSIWMKNFNNNTRYDLGYSERFNYYMIMYLVDCNTKEYTAKTGVAYDDNGSPITHIGFTLNDYQLKWQPIVPESIAAVAYNYACGGYR